jgi:hypothetical protein
MVLRREEIFYFVNFIFFVFGANWTIEFASFKEFF